jgi:hypothetical protein
VTNDWQVGEVHDDPVAHELELEILRETHLRLGPRAKVRLATTRGLRHIYAMNLLWQCTERLWSSSSSNSTTVFIMHVIFINVITIITLTPTPGLPVGIDAWCAASGTGGGVAGDVRA